MKKFLLPLVLMSGACAAPVENVEDRQPEQTAQVQNSAESVGDDCGRTDEQPGAVFPETSSGRLLPRISEQGIRARVVESIIQRNRVLLTLDAGSELGVYTGMRGILYNGRPFTIISVDFKTSRAVLTGLNIRISDGVEAVLSW